MRCCLAAVADGASEGFMAADRFLLAGLVFLAGSVRLSGSADTDSGPWLVEESTGGTGLAGAGAGGPVIAESVEVRSSRAEVATLTGCVWLVLLDPGTGDSLECRYDHAVARGLDAGH